MVILKLTEAQARILTAILHSGISAGSIKELGLIKVHKNLVTSMGAQKFSPSPESILILDESEVTQILPVDKTQGTDIIINCT